VVVRGGARCGEFFLHVVESYLGDKGEARGVARCRGVFANFWVDRMKVEFQLPGAAKSVVWVGA